MARPKEKVKSTYSSAFHLSRTFPPTHHIAVPRAIAPTIDQIKEIDASSSENATPEKIIPLITLKEITPVASLNKDSPSIIIFNLCGIGNFLNITPTGYRIGGPPGWGKGAVLVTFKLLGYRVILAGDMSGANILDLLGPIERCQITIAEDELDNLEDDEDKQRIYKMGYEDIGLVTRTVDPSSSDRTIRFYNPFGIKFFAGEKAPDSKQLGGFNDRTFRSEAKKGRPKLLMEDNSIFLTEDSKS